MLDKKDAILFENNKYYFNCLKCGRIIKSKPYYLSKHSGKCSSCSHQKRPYEHVYKRFCSTSKNENHSNHISYDQFLNYTKINNCHYCLAKIPWMEYAYYNGSYTRSGYFLDRKDNNLGYNSDNCVVCCTKCNISKGNKYSYKEWFGMTEYFRIK